MAIAHEVRLYDTCTGNVIATYLGITTRTEAMVRCVNRSSLADLEKKSLIAKVRYGFTSGVVDTKRWSFTLQSDKTI